MNKGMSFGEQKKERFHIEEEVGEERENTTGYHIL